ADLWNFFGNLIEQGEIGLGGCFGDCLTKDSLGLWVYFDDWIVLAWVGVEIPDIKDSHVLQAVHVHGVSGDATTDGSIAFAAVEAVFAGGDVDTGCEALEIPFPRCDESLIEVIQVKDNVAL